MSKVEDFRDAKQRYYSRPGVVAHYDAMRFGSAGGRYVNDLELRCVLEYLAQLDRGSAILDLPCGTGRLSRALRDAGFSCITAADASPPMLDAFRHAVPDVAVSRQDAFATDFPAAHFDAIVALRFLFHTPQASRLFAEWRRIVRAGGLVVFDTLRWTPRTLAPGLDRALGGRLVTHSDRAIRALAGAHGFEILASRRVLALPSLCYRCVPAPLLAPLAALEARLPRSLFTKTFYQLQAK